ncbi:hypothetical protein ACIQK5_04130 [Streptomyces virginiae]|uniref:hypothetical protein n=1 Tax=Streptomyces virginiae TaxID=1961 RepID=UPI00364E021C
MRASAYLGDLGDLGGLAARRLPILLDPRGTGDSAAPDGRWSVKIGGVADWPAVSRTERTDIIVRRILVITAVASLALAALATATVAVGAYLLRDLGPLPPRYSGPPLPREAVVSEMTSILAAEGITVQREPSGGMRTCHERLSGRHAPETADAAVEAAFARARSDHGWRDGPDLGERTLTLTKGNWTVMSSLMGEQASGQPAPVFMVLTCVDEGDAATAPTAPSASAPALTPAPASS